MGLSVSPAIWQNFITKVLDEILSKKHHIAIMDDCLIHSKWKDHITELIRLFCVQVWFENLAEEVPVFQNQACIHGTQHSHTG